MPRNWASRTPPPSYRRRIVTPYPDTRPVPTLRRHSGPRAGTQGTGAETTTTIIPHQHPHITPTPSFHPTSRNPDGRGYPLNLPHQRTRAIPRRTPSCRPPSRYPGDGRGYPLNPPHQRTCAIPRRTPSCRPPSRYPGDGRGYPLNPPHQRTRAIPRRTPSCRRRPVPRGRAWLPPQPSTSTYTCHPPANTVVPASPCTPIQGRNPEVRVGQREYDTNRVPPVPATYVCRGGSWSPSQKSQPLICAAPVGPESDICGDVVIETRRKCSIYRRHSDSVEPEIRGNWTYETGSCGRPPGCGAWDRTQPSSPRPSLMSP